MVAWRDELTAMLRPAAGGVYPSLRQVPRGAHKTTLLAARYFKQTRASTLRVDL